MSSISTETATVRSLRQTAPATVKTRSGEATFALVGDQLLATAPVPVCADLVAGRHAEPATPQDEDAILAFLAVSIQGTDAPRFETGEDVLLVVPGLARQSITIKKQPLEFNPAGETVCGRALAENILEKRPGHIKPLPAPGASPSPAVPVPQKPTVAISLPPVSPIAGRSPVIETVTEVETATDLDNKKSEEKQGEVEQGENSASTQNSAEVQDPAVEQNSAETQDPAAGQDAAAGQEPTNNETVVEAKPTPELITLVGPFAARALAGKGYTTVEAAKAADPATLIEIKGVATGTINTLFGLGIGRFLSQSLGAPARALPPSLN